MANRIRCGVVRAQVVRTGFENTRGCSGAGVYPISSFTWIVVPARSADDAKRNARTGFLQWMVGPGQRQSAAFGIPSPSKGCGR